MARIQHVKRAQQRYAQKPVLDEKGDQVITALGKTTKSGREVTRRQFVRDTEKPLPMPRCDFPGCLDPEIKVGTGYYHVTAKNSATKYRHDTHRRWYSWELTSAMWAQVERVATEAQDAIDALGDFDSYDDVKSVLESAAEEARELAEQRTEAADNMESGFGHETYASENLREHASNLEEWADALEGWEPNDSEPPQEDDFESTDCDTCNATGTVDCDTCKGAGTDDSTEDECPDCGGTGERDCDDCDGNGTVESDEVDTYEDAMENWREEVRDSATEVLNDTPEV